MEMILGVIEDLIEKFNSGNPDDVSDAKSSLKSNKGQFLKNLEELAGAGNPDAKSIMDKLNALNLD